MLGRCCYDALAHLKQAPVHTHTHCAAIPVCNPLPNLVETVHAQDVLQRHAQLAAWTANGVQLPVSVWLPGLFNPKAFLTALMQVLARANITLNIKTYTFENTC